MSTQRSTAGVEGLATTDQDGSNRVDIASQYESDESAPCRRTGIPRRPCKSSEDQLLRDRKYRCPGGNKEALPGFRAPYNSEVIRTFLGITPI
jgi:hypothetical protein